MAERTGAPTKASTRTIDALVDEYLRERLARRELNRPSAKNHRCTLERFAAAVADTPVRKLTQADVERWLETREAVSATTRRGDLSRVRTFCGWLVRRGYLRSDPTVEMPPIRQPRRLPRSQAPEAVARLLSVVPDARGRLMCLAMLQEGLRCAEVERLQLGDIDFGGRQVLIRGKGGHERALPISDETWAALDDYLAEFPATSGPLIRSYKQPWRPLTADSISGLVGGWCSDAGIKRWARDGVSAHSLRHTCAVDMLRHGATPLAVRDALGHSHLSTTELYLRGYVNDLRKAMGGRKYRGLTPDPPAPGREAGR